MKKLKKILDSECFTAFLFLTPVVVLWIWWFIIPFFKSIQYSLFDFNYAIPDRTKYVGLKNFTDLFEDAYFLDAIRHTVTLVLCTVPIIIVLSLLISIALDTRVKGRGIVRTMVYLPYVLSSIAVATIFMYLLAKGKAIPFLCSRLFGMDNVTWVADIRYALRAVMVMYIWQQIGFNMVLFIAGLQGISYDMREAARIDGAGPIQEFFYITLPGLRTTLSMTITMGIISAMKIFDQISAISRNSVLGAPAGSTSTIVTYFYVNAFRYGKMGYASAAALVLFAIIFVLTIIQRILVAKSEEAA